MRTTTTQHEDALKIAETIRAFRDQHPTDADRLLGEYADLHPPTYRDDEIEEKDEEIERLEGAIDDLWDNLANAKRFNEALQSDLVKAEERIEELETPCEEENA